MSVWSRLRRLVGRTRPMKVLAYYRCQDCDVSFRTEVDDKLTCPECGSHDIEQLIE